MRAQQLFFLKIHSKKIIAEKLSLSKTTVEYMIQTTTTSKEMQDRAQTSTREIRKIQIWSRNLAPQKSQKTNFLSKTEKISHHNATIRRHLNGKGLKYSKKPKTLLLTLIQKEKEWRIVSAGSLIEWTGIIKFFGRKKV